MPDPASANMGLVLSPDHDTDWAADLTANYGKLDLHDHTTGKGVTVGGLPIGGIILWSGAIAAIPANWHLCDGAAGTPDLRNRFIVGAGDTYAVAANGGSATVNVAHAHAAGAVTVNVEATHFHATSFMTGADWGYAAVNVWDGNEPHLVSHAAAHVHLVSGNTATGSAHTHGASGAATDSQLSVALENRPPYYALAYIMRTA